MLAPLVGLHYAIFSVGDWEINCGLIILSHLAGSDWLLLYACTIRQSHMICIMPSSVWVIGKSIAD